MWAVRTTALARSSFRTLVAEALLVVPISDLMDDRDASVGTLNWQEQDECLVHTTAIRVPERVDK